MKAVTFYLSSIAAFLLVVVESADMLAPSTYSKFRKVSDEGVLAGPNESSEWERNLTDFHKWIYKALAGREGEEAMIMFQVRAPHYQSLLVECNKDPDQEKQKASWSVEKGRYLRADIHVPKQKAGVDQFTILDALSSEFVSMFRVAWRRSWEDRSDVFLLYLRRHPEDDDYEAFYLGKRTAKMISFDIDIRNALMDLSLDGERVLSKLGSSSWKNEKMHFRTGIRRLEAKRGSTAKVMFSNLEWGSHE